MNIHSCYDPFLTHFRRRRVRALYRLLGIRASTKLLDLGGNWFFWKLAVSERLPLPQITIVNLYPELAERDVRGRWVIADGRRLPFRDQAFDLVFSNSVIEHLGDWPSQVAFAREISRIGRRHFVQTPNRWFPVEPHLLTPFIHWLPKRQRLALLRNFTLWGLVTRPSTAECQRFLQQVRLLTVKEMTALFPDSAVLLESCLGCAKSIIALRA